MKVEDFTPYIAANIPECPPFIIERAALSAVILFCSTSWILNELLDKEDAESGESLITFSSSNNKPVCGILEILWDDDPLEIFSEKEMNRLYSSWRTDTGEPTSAVRAGLTAVSLYPTPDQLYEDYVQAKIAYTPRRSDSVIDDIFSTNYFEAICDGATATLLFQPHKSWYNPELALPFQQSFSSSMYSARNLVMRDVYQRRPPVPQL